MALGKGFYVSSYTKACEAPYAPEIPGGGPDRGITRRMTLVRK